ncbi:MAG: hypothetical protein CMF50_03965 [Legionellales bacterium]|nr:hypothetical protein [Legionellales bacterium]
MPITVDLRAKRLDESELKRQIRESDAADIQAFFDIYRNDIPLLAYLANLNLEQISRDDIRNNFFHHLNDPERAARAYRKLMMFTKCYNYLTEDEAAQLKNIKYNAEQGAFQIQKYLENQVRPLGVEAFERRDRIERAADSNRLPIMNIRRNCRQKGLANAIEETSQQILIKCSVATLEPAIRFLHDLIQHSATEINLANRYTNKDAEKVNAPSPSEINHYTKQILDAAFSNNNFNTIGKGVFGRKTPTAIAEIRAELAKDNVDLAKIQRIIDKAIADRPTSFLGMGGREESLHDFYQAISELVKMANNPSLEMQSVAGAPSMTHSGGNDET